MSHMFAASMKNTGAISLILESNFVDDGPSFKVENNTWKNLNMHLKIAI